MTEDQIGKAIYATVRHLNEMIKKGGKKDLFVQIAVEESVTRGTEKLHVAIAKKIRDD